MSTIFNNGTSKNSSIDNHDARTSSVAREGAAIGTIKSTAEAVKMILKDGALSKLASRVASENELTEVNAELIAERDRSIEQLIRAANRNQENSLVDQIVRILDKASTYKSRTKFDDPSSMATLRTKIKTAISRGRILTFIIPVGGGKAPNPTKTGDHYLGDVTESMAVIKFAAIAMAISEIYPHGVTVIPVADAPLHTEDLGFSASESNAHLRNLQNMLQSLGIARFVEIANTLEHLPDDWPDEVRKQTRLASARITEDSDYRQNVYTQINSLQYSINTRDYDWNFEHNVLVNAALAGATDNLPQTILNDAAEVYHRTELVVPHYIGVNYALRTLDIPARVADNLTGSSEYIRLTVHAKPGEPRPLLTQNNKHARPGMLPMHSVGLRFQNGKGQWRYAGIFKLEAVINGYQPVVHPDTGQLIYYEDPHAS